MDENKGFIGTLFDFSFSDFVTSRVIKFLYVIGIIVALIGAIVFIVGGFRLGAGWGVLALLISPLIFLIYSLLIRVYLEIIIVIFRIAENVQRLADRHEAPASAPAPQAPRASSSGDSIGHGTVAEDQDF